MIALIGFTTGFLKYYIDAKVDPIKAYIDARIGALEGKIDPIAKDVKLLVDYMIQHEGRISRLEERTK